MSTEPSVWEYSEGEEVTGDNLAGEYFKVILHMCMRFLKCLLPKMHSRVLVVKSGD